MMSAPRAAVRLPNFYDAVYQIVRAIPRGKLVAYGWIATWLGSPRAARAVGYALAACPSQGVPWQRVINSQGEISIGGQLWRPERQKALLQREGVLIDARGHIDLRAYAFEPTTRQLKQWGAFHDGIDSPPIERRSNRSDTQRLRKELAMADQEQHNPPAGVKKACEQGLRLKDEGHGGKGLVDKTIGWAKHMAAGKATPTMQHRRMAQWFARHKVDKRPGWEKEPTPGYVAWQLWGGDAGMRWANTIVKRADAAQSTAKKTKKKTAKKTRKKATKKSGKKTTKKKTKKKSRSK